MRLHRFIPAIAAVVLTGCASLREADLSDMKWGRSGGMFRLYDESENPPRRGFLHGVDLTFFPYGTVPFGVAYDGAGRFVIVEGLRAYDKRMEAFGSGPGGSGPVYGVGRNLYAALIFEEFLDRNHNGIFDWLSTSNPEGCERLRVREYVDPDEDGRFELVRSRLVPAFSHQLGTCLIGPGPMNSAVRP